MGYKFPYDRRMDTLAPPPSPTDADTCASSEVRVHPDLLPGAMPALLAHFDPQSLRCRFASPDYARQAGHTPASILGRPLRELVDDAQWRVLAPALRQAQAGRAAQCRCERAPAGGEPRVLLIDVLPQFAAPAPEGGPAQVVGLFLLAQDASRQLRAERAVQESEERMRKFSAATEEGIAFHTDGFITDCNEALLHLTGYRRAEVLGRSLLEFIHPQDHESVRSYVGQGREDPYEVAVFHKDGSLVTLEVVGKTMPRAAGGYRVVVVRDATARHQAQQRAEFLAWHDPLTQLPNRRHLMRQLERLQQQAQERPVQAALLFLDLDHFRTVNESLGHAAGDQLLCEVARRLQAVAGAGRHFIARVGGDQFVMLLSDVDGHDAAAREADALLAHVRAPYAIDGTPVSISPSLGISLFPGDGHVADELLRRAASAMQQAKDSGRGTRLFYAPGMEGQPALLLRQEHLLREAVEQQSFELHYQPQVEVASGRLRGLEALVRWQHPEQGLVGPDAFIGLAESRGLITHIGRWVLRQACRQMRAWHDAGLPRVPVAVNLSAIEFRQRDVVGDIAQVLRESGLAPQFLEVEITESVLMHDVEGTRATLAALQTLGVAVTVDDFGTGYSSLAYLKRYPLDKIKVDRSFVMDTPNDAGDVAIVTAVVQLARGLQLRSVAEGVETDEQMALLRRLGCDLAQGFGVSRPLPAVQIQAWMQSLPAS